MQPKRTGRSRTTKPNPRMIDDLIAANRILYDQGVLDAFGHVSVRDVDDPNRFWMARSIAPSLVGPKDILPFDFNGSPLVSDPPKIYIERFIHSEILRRRSDVMAVVHSHSPTLIPFACSKTALRPLSQVSGFLGEGAPVFDIRAADANGVDMLIRTPSLGEALVDTMGDNVFVLLRGHGSVTCGPSLPKVVWRAIYAEVNARQQIQAMSMGPVQFLSPEEARHAAKTVPNDPERAWTLWKHNATRRA